MKAEDWAKLDSMNYLEAGRYMEGHSKELSGFDVLKNSFSSLQNFLFFLKSNLWIFVITFITALITALRVMKINRHIPKSEERG